MGHEGLWNYTVIELGADCESPMVGTIANVDQHEDGIVENVKERLVEALSEHFDCEDIHFTDPLPDLFTGSVWDDIAVNVDDNNYKIRILQTWMY